MTAAEAHTPAIVIDFRRETFFGFTDVPFHMHVGLRFRRRDPDAPADVTLPPSTELTSPHGEHSPAALYTLAEVASGLAASEALSMEQRTPDDGLLPIMLATQATFRPVKPARGEIRAEPRLVGDAAEKAERLAVTRKVTLLMETSLTTVDGLLAAQATFSFYLRLMRKTSLLAMRVAARGGHG